MGYEAALFPIAALLAAFLAGSLGTLGIILVVSHVYAKMSGNRSPVTMRYEAPEEIGGELPYIARTDAEEIALDAALRRRPDAIDSVPGLGR